MTAAESRPALPEVLACLVDGDPRMAEFWRAATKPYDGDAKITLRVDATAEGVGTFNVIDGHELRSVARQPWRHASPAEALEALQTAGHVGGGDDVGGGGGARRATEPASPTLRAPTALRARGSRAATDRTRPISPRSSRSRPSASRSG